MVHYKAHNGYEMHRVFNLPPIEFRINQPLKKIIEFLFFKKIYERKQVPSSLVPYDKKYFLASIIFQGFLSVGTFFCRHGRRYTQGFYIQSAPVQQETKEMSEQIDHDETRFPYMYAGEITWNPNIGKQPAVYANCLITSTP